jgi:hypothetical protein
MNMTIRDLKWDYNEQLDRFAAPGLGGYYLIKEDNGVYHTTFIETGGYFKYDIAVVSQRDNYKESMEDCNQHHRNRLIEKYLEVHE